MNWLSMTNRIVKKPSLFVILPIVLFFVLLLAKWQLNLPFEALWFFVGGIVGIYLLDIVEEVFQLSPSPFRTIVFCIGLFILTFYLITSTREYLAKGLGLSLLCSLFLLYVNDWRVHHTSKEWFSFLFDSFDHTKERTVVGVFGIAILLLFLLFIFS